MAQVRIGNSAAKHAVGRDKDGALLFEDLPGRRVTTVHIPDEYTLMEKVAVIAAQDGVWNNHSQGANPTDSTPDWVESDDVTLEAILRSHFGVAGQPKSWHETTEGGGSNPG